MQTMDVLKNKNEQDQTAGYHLRTKKRNRGVFDVCPPGIIQSRYALRCESGAGAS